MPTKTNESPLNFAGMLAASFLLPAVSNAIKGNRARKSQGQKSTAGQLLGDAVIGAADNSGNATSMYAQQQFMNNSSGPQYYNPINDPNALENNPWMAQGYNSSSWDANNQNPGGMLTPTGSSAFAKKQLVPTGSPMAKNTSLKDFVNEENMKKISGVNTLTGASSNNLSKLINK